MRRIDHAPASEFWPAYLRGLAYFLTVERRRERRSSVPTILEHRGRRQPRRSTRSRMSACARAAVITGDLDQGRKAYESFLDLWKGADSTLGIWKTHAKRTPAFSAYSACTASDVDVAPTREGCLFAALACAPADSRPFPGRRVELTRPSRQEVESLLAFHEEERDRDNSSGTHRGR